MSKILYDNSSANILLGCLLNNPSLCLSEKYPLDKTDFYDKDTKEGLRFHQILFVCVQQLASQGAKEISAIDVMEFIKPYSIQYEVLQDNNAVEFIETVKKLSKADNIDVYYTIVRKMSLLRAYNNQGFDITDIYNDDGDEEQERRKLNEYDIDDIIKYFNGKLANISKRFKCDKTIEETKAGLDFFDIKESLKKAPLWGKPFISDYLTNVTRGAINGQLSIFSSLTGVGKTTIMCANLANMTATELYNTDTNTWEINKQKTSNGVLYGQFELSNELECVPKFLSYITAVSMDKILNGNYTPEEESRINYGIQVMDDSNINIICLPNFTISSIENIVKDYVLNKGIDIFGWDYIQECSALNGELVKNNGGVAIRTDQILQTLASRLKDLARNLNIHIYSSTQCNANVSTSVYMDASVISGSRSLANKCDIGCVVLQPTKKELELVKPILDKRGFGEKQNPTHVCHVYKSRFSSHPMNLKIFWHIDMGTGRLTDLVTTNFDGFPYKFNNKVKIQKG